MNKFFDFITTPKLLITIIYLFLIQYLLLKGRFEIYRFNEVANGSTAPDGFLTPGTASDFFENLNVLAIVVEVPNSMLETMLETVPEHILNGQGNINGLPNAYNVWLTTSRLQ